MGARENKRFFTAEEAVLEIPYIESELLGLKVVRKYIVEEEDMCDAEEVTSYGLEGDEAEVAKKKIDGHLVRIKLFEREFENKVRMFESSGLTLKGLDPGLVDFTAMREGEECVLCWREGEQEVGHWHLAKDSCEKRQPLI